MISVEYFVRPCYVALTLKSAFETLCIIILMLLLVKQIVSLTNEREYNSSAEEH